VGFKAKSKFREGLQKTIEFGANRANESELRIGFSERFPGIRFDERPLVCSAMNSFSTSSEISASAA